MHEAPSAAGGVTRNKKKRPKRQNAESCAWHARAPLGRSPLPSLPSADVCVEGGRRWMRSGSPQRARGWAPRRWLHPTTRNSTPAGLPAPALPTCPALPAREDRRGEGGEGEETGIIRRSRVAGALGMAGRPRLWLGSRARGKRRGCVTGTHRRWTLRLVAGRFGGIRTVSSAKYAFVVYLISRRSPIN